MSRNTSISIGDYFDRFIQNRLIALRESIQEGIESGIAHNFNPELHLEELKAKKRLNG